MVTWFDGAEVMYRLFQYPYELTQAIPLALHSVPLPLSNRLVNASTTVGLSTHAGHRPREQPGVEWCVAND